MLESHHSLVVKALQRLYKLCLNKDGFPGEPLTESPDGYPLTHAILDRLGLIKQAEENAEEPDEDTEDLQYLRYMATSGTDCSATTDPSPEPVTPPEPSPNHCSPINPSPKVNVPYKWEYQLVHPAHAEQYTGYQHAGFHSMTMPRSAVDLPGLPAESKCPGTLPSVSNPENSYFYYADASGNAETTKGPLHPGVTTGPGSHHHTAGMPVEMLGNYNLHLQDQQPLYHGLTSWTSYPCG
jgi:hypothetical protein